MEITDKTFSDIKEAFNGLTKIEVPDNILKGGTIKFLNNGIKLFKDDILIWTIEFQSPERGKDITVFSNFIEGTLYGSHYQGSCYIRRNLLRDYAFDDEVNWFSDLMEELIDKAPILVAEDHRRKEEEKREAWRLRCKPYPYYDVIYNYDLQKWDIGIIEGFTWQKEIRRSGRYEGYTSPVTDHDLLEFSNRSLERATAEANAMNKTFTTKICRSCKKAFAMSPNNIAWFIDRDLSIPNNCETCRDKKKNGIN